MSGGDDAGKTEKPTPKRLQDARKEGQFPRTVDAPTWMGIALGFALVPTTVSWGGAELRPLMARVELVALDPSRERVLEVVSNLPWTLLWIVLPVALAAAVGGLLGASVQGVYPSLKVLKPKFKRMNPWQGLKRMFGKQGAWEAAKALLKVIAISLMLYAVGTGIVVSLTSAGIMPLRNVIEQANDGLRTIVYAVVLMGLIIAVADYSFQRHTVMKQLKMTMREIKDENKQAEGDPLLKSARRSKQIAMSRNRMMAKVSEADVVLVNPTHIAIALKYAAGTGAPRVVAKGSGAVALKIREAAQENRVPVVQDKPLARALFKICELDDEIPSELYIAVAKVLAFVMAAGKPTATAQPRRTPQASDVPENLPSKSEFKVRKSQERRKARKARREK